MGEKVAIISQHTGQDPVLTRREWWNATQRGIVKVAKSIERYEKNSHLLVFYLRISVDIFFMDVTRGERKITGRVVLGRIWL